MTDAELVEKKLAEIETLVHELRSKADVGRMRGDVKEERLDDLLAFGRQIRERLPE